MASDHKKQIRGSLRSRRADAQGPLTLEDRFAPSGKSSCLLPRGKRSSSHARGVTLLKPRGLSPNLALLEGTKFPILKPCHRRDAPQGNVVCNPQGPLGPLLKGTEFPVLKALCAAPQVSHAFFLRIAGITISLQSDDPEFKIEVVGATKKFLVDQADPDMKVQARWADLSREKYGEKIFDSGPLWQLYSEEDSYCFTFTSSALGPVPYKIARFDKEFSPGQVYLHRPYFPSWQPLYPLDYPLDELLLVNLLARGRGVEVHACGVRDSRGNGHLFVGQSGAGKSTMARLWQKDSAATVLSDDRIILRNDGSGFRMYGTPWHGEAELASPEKAPLEGVYFLAKGSKNEIIPLKQSDAASRLFACSFPPFYSPQGLDFTLTFLEEVVKSIPCYELMFQPDRKVLKIVMSNED